MEVYLSKLQQIQELVGSQVTTLPCLQYLLSDFQVRCVGGQLGGGEGVGVCGGGE
jgi:hypothetical protein